MQDGVTTKPSLSYKTANCSPARDASGCRCMTETTAPLLVGVAEVARLLTCSKPHVRRMADAGRMPKPVRLGALVRWNRVEIEQWLAAGCPDARRGALP